MQSYGYMATLWQRCQRLEKRMLSLQAQRLFMCSIRSRNCECECLGCAHDAETYSRVCAASRACCKPLYMRSGSRWRPEHLSHDSEVRETNLAMAHCCSHFRYSTQDQPHFF